MSRITEQQWPCDPSNHVLETFCDKPAPIPPGLGSVDGADVSQWLDPERLRDVV